MTDPIPPKVTDLKLTPEQDRAARRAGMLGLAANVALDMGTITPERHREVLRSLAPALTPVFEAMAEQVRAARAEAPDEDDSQ